MKALNNKFSPMPSSKNKLYPANSAGRIAESAVPVVGSRQTIKEVVSFLENNVHKFESINYIYVLNRNSELSGVLSIKDTLRQDPSAIVKKVMKTDPIKAHPFTHQEKVAFLALQNNIKAVPVVDKNGIFIGAVLSDTILEVLHHEMQRDLSNISGVPNFPPGRDILGIPIRTVIMHRLPWLILGLLGILFAAKAIGFFEGTLEDNLILASFIPLIMYMGGSTLAQTEAFFIRDLAIAPNFSFLKYFNRQFIVTALMALLLSALAFVLNLFLISDLRVNCVIVFALFSVLCMTTFTSLLIPYLFNKFGKDPADGSGPIATIFQDVLGVIVYFTIASILL